MQKLESSWTVSLENFVAPMAIWMDDVKKCSDKNTLKENSRQVGFSTVLSSLLLCVRKICVYYKG